MRRKACTLVGGLLWLEACAGGSAPLFEGRPGGGGGGGMSAGGGAVGSVTVGNLFFKSAHNGTQNPAVDTISVNASLTWTWNETGTPHSVESTESPRFTSETGTQSTNGATYRVTFTTRGTYTYICSVHPTRMSGRIVVQ